MTTLAESSAVSTGPHLDNRRVAAALIDLVIPAAIGAAAYAAGLSLTRGVVLVAVGWTLYYFFALESGDGQTLGKRLMKLRVVSADGTPASMAQIAKRTAVRILDGHIVGLIVMLATGERRQRLGDIVAGTVVTEAGATARSEASTVEEVDADPPREPTPARSRRSLSMPSIPRPSLSMPSRRDRSARQSTVGPAPAVPWYKRSLSMSSLRRRPTHDADSVAQAAAAVPAPMPSAPTPAPREPVSRLEQFDPLPPEPRHDPGPEPIEDFMQREAVIEREPEVELDVPDAYDDEPLDGFDREPSVEVEDPHAPEYETVVEYEADVERAVAHEAAPKPGDGSPDEDVVVKPVETISAIDLVMQDAEDRRPDDR